MCAFATQKMHVNMYSKETSTLEAKSLKFERNIFQKITTIQKFSTTVSCIFKLWVAFHKLDPNFKRYFTMPAPSSLIMTSFFQVKCFQKYFKNNAMSFTCLLHVTEEGLWNNNKY